MNNPRHAARLHFASVLFKTLQQIGFSVPTVDDHGELGFQSQIELLLKSGNLNLFWRMSVVIIQSDFPNCSALWMLCCRSEGFQVTVLDGDSFVWVDSHCMINI